jgi:WD40 repeat protein
VPPLDPSPFDSRPTTRGVGAIMSEPHEIDDQAEHLEVGGESAVWSQRARALAGRLIIPVALVVVVAIGWSEVRTAEHERRAARAEELTAAAVAALDTDASLAKLLALVAAEAAPPTPGTLAVLRRTLVLDVRAEYFWPAEHLVGHLWTHLRPDATLLVAAGTYPAGDRVEVWDISAEALVWSTDVEAMGIGGTGIESPFFSPDGELVVAGITAQSEPSPEPVGAVLWDAESGELLRRIDVGHCGAIVDAVSDTHLLVAIPIEDRRSCWSDEHVRLELIHLESGQRQVLTSQATLEFPRAMSSDGRFVTFTFLSPEPRTVVVDAATSEEVFGLDQAAYVHGWGHPRLLNDDGSLLIAGSSPVEVWDVDSGEIIATFDGHASGATYATLSSDGRNVYSLGVDGVLRRWDARTGTEIVSVPASAQWHWFSVAEDLALVKPRSPRLAVQLLFTGVRGDVDVIGTCAGPVLPGTLGAAGEYAALSQVCGDGEAVTLVVDLAAAEVMRTVEGHYGEGLALAPDGTRFARHDAGAEPGGALRVRDLASGGVVAELEDTPDPLRVSSLVWSPDSRLVAAGNAESGTVHVWDAASGVLVGGYDRCRFGLDDAVFSRDGAELIVSCSSQGLIALSTVTGEEVRAGGLDRGSGMLALVGFDSDWSTLVAVEHAGGKGVLHWIDGATLEIETSTEEVFAGSPSAWAANSTGSLAAVGTRNGIVRVWDIETRQQVDEIDVGGGRIEGVAFAGEKHLVVARERGSIHLYTLDADEVLEAVRNSITRGFTPAECVTFGFGDDCPSEAAT